MTIALSSIPEFEASGSDISISSDYGQQVFEIPSRKN